MLESLWPESLQLCWRETPTGMFSVSAPVVATPVGGCCCWGVGEVAAVVRGMYGAGSGFGGGWPAAWGVQCLFWLGNWALGYYYLGF